MITFLLCQRGILAHPLLYLSLYLKTHRAEYYDRLMAVRVDGNWEAWIKFFLRGVFEVSQSATQTARAILQMREDHRQAITANLAGRSAMGLQLLDLLYEQPIVSVAFAEKQLECSYVTANKIIGQFTDLNLLREITGGQRNRRFRYGPFLDLFDVLGDHHQHQEVVDTETTESGDEARRP